MFVSNLDFLYLISQRRAITLRYPFHMDFLRGNTDDGYGWGLIVMYQTINPVTLKWCQTTGVCPFDDLFNQAGVFHNKSST